MKVKGKTIVVTGGGNGMGRQIVLYLLSKGSNVIAIDLNEKALNETKTLAKDAGNSPHCYVADITDKNSIELMAKEIIVTHGPVSGIINNAGILQPFQRISDMDFEIIDRVFKVNFYGMLYMTKTFLPSMLELTEAHIVNISSMGGFLPVAGQGIYGASKAAVKLFSESLGSELSETNVGVTTVFPGAIQTNIKRNSGLGKEAGVNADEVSEGMAFSPAKAAAIIIDAIENKRGYVYIGKDAKSMNMMYRICPSFATHLIYGKMKHKI